ncbi:SusC/RagA family TonB-linked outer membrane protein [Tunicatimonas pelagia]|uniref:SusC/RagA family TonB-linked outer membrane protein n=1 Tax=Tunicatimonas pelagia TaxID=931531 RepID=UPI002666CBCA|nr:TonB-dependent receptor [Tunicatimonas pelagia]WKN46278.1 TonB-dependent receptor [Tunicatimonas pelagia]
MPPRFTKLATLYLGIILLGSHLAFSQSLAFFQKSTVANTKTQPLIEVLTEVEHKHSVRFDYEKLALQDKYVDAEIWQQSTQDVEQALQTLLPPLGLTYKKYPDNTYVIYSPPATKKTQVTPLPNHRPDTNASVSLPTHQSAVRAVTNTVFSRAKIDKEIRGKVTDLATDEPLPGVNVVVKGTVIGTVTDVDGNYGLVVPDDAEVLVFTYVGFEREEIAIGNQTVIDVSLAPDLQSLQEVVVVGYGTQEKSSITGSISSIKGESLRQTVAAQPDAMLQGKVAGVQVVQNTGAPGAEVFLRVRGTASLRADTRPLYVIDGVPMNNINQANFSAGQRASALANLNPNDIESIEILKDAAATAIYGSRGSNGVVLITTKRGSDGKATFSFDGYHGVQSVWKTLDLLDGQGFSNTLREAVENRNAVAGSTIADLSDDEYVQALTVTGENTDWQDEVFRLAPISNYNLSVSGGEGRIRSFASLGVFSQEGIIIGQDFDRITGRLNLDYQATDKLKINTSITYSNTQKDEVANDFSSISVLGNALLSNPNLPVYNPDGTYTVDPLGRNGAENPVMLANEITFDNLQRRLIANVQAEYEIMPNLTFRSVLGIDNLSERIERFLPSFILSTGGSADAEAINAQTSTWLNDNTLTYQREMGEHNISALAGFGVQRTDESFLRAGGRVAGSDIITTVAIANPDLPQHYLTAWSLLSYFGRVNYTFRDRYVLEASFRADGSSRFGENNRFGYFPAISGAWRAIEEPFLQNVDWLSNLKVRAAYGITGNQEGLDNFGSLTRYGTGRNYDGNPGISQVNVPNPDLSWESTESINLGVDIGLLQERISLSVDAYNRDTRDLLFTRQLPWTSGFSSLINENVGNMRNQGIELALTTRNFNGAFRWTTDFNISFNRNEITSLPSNGVAGSDFIFQLPSAYSAEGPYSIYRVGQPIGSFYGFEYQGIYRTDEDVPENLRDDGANNNFAGGFPIFRDTDGNGIYQREFDRVIIGNALPLHTGGMTNTFGYKNFELSVVLNWSYGNDVYNMTRAALTSMADDFNQLAEVEGRWQQPGDEAIHPIAMYSASSFQGISFSDASSRYIEDGSFLRVRNISLGYSLANSLLENTPISAARVYVTGQNLFTFTNYSGLDPESQNTGGGLIPTLGVDYLTQPQPRTVLVGVNISF